jgi:uncharacterized protein
VIRGALLSAAAAAALVLGSGCSTGAGVTPAEAAAARTVVTVRTEAGAHKFDAEVVDTQPKQRQGLMYRTSLAPDAAMLFAPYPPDGSGPVDASFWMKNVPISIDILFIRPDGTIARIAENAVPMSEDHILSGEPVSAVLEIAAGRSAELGIRAGDKVSWPAQRR